MSNNTIIIAEAGVNHNGDYNTALKLCDAAKEVGADFIKFQTWKTENVVTRFLPQASYQSENIGMIESQYAMLKKLELSYDDFWKIKQYCDNIGIGFASTADEIESLNFLLTVGIPFIKIASSEIKNLPFLKYAGTKGLPIILSTGMSRLSDVDVAIESLRQGGATDITLLHCTTSYPCNPDEVNINAMVTLKKAFKLPVGYSDHTVGKEAAISAVTLGATVIEKHFTLDKNMEGPDHIASLDVKGFRELVNSIRVVERMLGDGIKKETLSERNILPYVTKRIVASRFIKAGEVFSVDNITVKRSENGELAENWDNILGKSAFKNYEVDAPIYL